MDIHRFLHDHRITNGSASLATHGSLDPPGKYLITNEEKQTFYRLYNQYNTQNKKYAGNLSITELQVSTTIPLLIDVDLKASMETNQENRNLYTLQHVQNIYSAYTTTLQNVLDPRPLDENLTAFLMERPGYIETKKEKQSFKNGFHLVFPYIWLSRTNIKHFILPRVITYLESNHLEIPSVSDYDTIIDKGIYSGKGKPWFVYGSTKPIEGLVPYAVTKCLCTDNSEISVSKQWGQHLMRFPVTYTSHSDDESQLKQFCLPEIFSVQLEELPDDFYYEISSEVELETSMDNEMLSHELIPEDLLNIEGYYEEKSEEKDYEFFDKLLELLPHEFSEEHDKWMQTGWIIFNYFDGSLSGFERWDRHSKKCFEKYNYETCSRQWNSMVRKDKEVGIGTLRYLCRTHRPLEYKNLCATLNPIRPVDLLEHTSHFDLANLLYHEYQDQYVLSNVKRNEWYEFKDHVWSKNDEGIFLRKKISTFLVSKYENLLRKLKKEDENQFRNNLEHLQQEIAGLEIEKNELKSNEPDNYLRKIEKIDKNLAGLKKKLSEFQSEDSKSHNRKQKKSDIEDQMERIGRIIASLKSSPFKKNIMIEAKELFYNDKFAAKLNSAVYKVAFNNGVYDLNDHIFREGVPDDYLSIKMDVNYRSDFTMESPEVQNAMDFFHKVFPDPALRQYFLELQSEMWVGRNARKIFQIWVGVGDNAKSITQDIFERLLGPYAAKLPTSLLTQKRTASSSASPELVRAGQGCRMCFFQEPGKTDKFNTGLLKELSGNDKFFARALHQDPIDICPMFKLVCIANHAPVIENSQNDEAIWSRVRIVPFQSKFPKNDLDVPETKEEQIRQKIFIRDPDFSDKIPSMLEAIAFLLLSIFKTKSNKLVEPPCVMEATKKYRDKCDTILKFINLNIVDKQGAELKLDVIVKNYKNFMTDNGGKRNSVSDDDDIKEYLRNKVGYCSTTEIWKNVCLKSDLEEEYDDNEEIINN